MTELAEIPYVGSVNIDSYIRGKNDLYKPDELFAGKEYVMRVISPKPSAEIYGFDFKVTLEANEVTDSGLTLRKFFPNLADIILASSDLKSVRKIGLHGLVYEPAKYVLPNSPSTAKEIGYFPRKFLPPIPPNISPLL